jgi:hypothetical protein
MALDSVRKRASFLRAFSLLQRNRNEYLLTLANIITPLTPAGSVVVSTLTLIDMIRHLCHPAIQNSRIIVQTMSSSTSE